MVLIRRRYPSSRTLMICALALLVAVMFQGTALAAQPKQKTFGTTMKRSLSPFSDPAVRH